MTQRPNDSMTTSSSLGPHLLFADVCVGLLNQGQSVRFKATGWSMQPTICDGEMINVEPVLPSQVRHGDIILYRNPRGITAHRVIHIQKEMEPHGQASDPIQPPMWGDIPVRSWRNHSSAGADSVLSPQPSVKLSGHWVIRLLGHFWVSVSPNSQRRTPNFPTCPSTLDPRPSSLIFYTRGDSLMADDFPVMSDQILGKVFSVERNGRAVVLYGIRAIMLQEMRLFLFTLKRYVVQALSRMKGLLHKYETPFKIDEIGSE
jgi:hypothetical protein